jgi:3D (Asp-Asp-Asp) domain-containing protein
LKSTASVPVAEVLVSRLMPEAAAALALILALVFPASGEPAAYESVVAAEAAAAESTTGVELDAEQAELMAGDPDWRASARLYHAGGGGATGNDSLGCRPIPMRTVAVDPRVIPRRTRLFIRETVGLRLADGTVHDGYWYASDTGGAIKGAKVDLFTGNGRGSMQPVMGLNMRTLSIAEAGRFDGCPPAWESAAN